MQPFGAGQIQPGLVQRQRLDQRRQGLQPPHDPPALGLVADEVGLQHHRLGAELQGGEHRHGRTDARDACDVTGGGDHPPLGAAHDHRLVAQLRPVTLLHRGVEGVAIQVGDGQRVQLCVRDDPGRGAARAAPDLDVVAGPQAVAAERLHDAGSSGHSHAAPRTPEESPCRAATTGVSNTSENMRDTMASGRRP